MKPLIGSDPNAGLFPRKARLGVESLEDRRTLSAWNGGVLNVENLVPLKVESRTATTLPAVTTVTPITASRAQAPAQANTAPLAKLPPINIGGDPNKRITAWISAPTGQLSYGGTDRSIQVSSATNARGGTTLTLTGTVASLNKSFASVLYRGFESQALIQIGSGSKVCSSATLRLRRI